MDAVGGSARSTGEGKVYVVMFLLPVYRQEEGAGRRRRGTTQEGCCVAEVG